MNTVAQKEETTKTKTISCEEKVKQPRTKKPKVETKDEVKTEGAEGEASSEGDQKTKEQ